MTELIPQALVWAVAVITIIPSVIILIQCLAAWFGVESRTREPAENIKLLVIIPAHNEAAGIEPTCASIQSTAAGDNVDVEIVVVADNCTDDTARLATAAGVRVLERKNDHQRGKGYALAWATEQLREEYWDGLVVLDADSRTAPGFFAAIADEFSRGTPAMQAFYGSDPSDDKRAALMQLALSLFNGARPLGRYVLGSSASITGNGFALSRQCLNDVPFKKSGALAEDLEHSLALAIAGYRIKQLVDARVSAAPAGDDESAISQRIRWEAGRVHAVRRWFFPLLRRGTWTSMETTLNLMIPPLAVIIAGQLMAACLVLLSGRVTVLYLIGVGPVATLLSLVLTCRIVGLPLRTMLVLQHAVWYLFWKIGIYFSKTFWHQKAWVRTNR